MHFVSQIALPPSEASRVTVTGVFQQPASRVMSRYQVITAGACCQPEKLHDHTLLQEGK
jgi:hypothetical protein